MCVELECASGGTEAGLREEVLDAIEELRRAQSEQKVLMEIGSDVAATPDGVSALGAAVLRHGHALAKLRAALKKFEAFLSRGFNR